MAMWPWPGIHITLPHCVLATEPKREQRLREASLIVRSHTAVAGTGTIN